MKTLYNDFNPDSVAWLNQLIENGDISKGNVIGGDFRELNIDDLRKYDTVHLFAGIAGWDYALRLAGWSGPVWTASLPCQPFSPAGKGKGKDDDRHLLPDFLDLVAKCRPNVLFGEQSPGAIKHGWFDDLQTGLEAEGYIVGHCVLGAHSVNAPHIRNRLYWAAYRNKQGLEGRKLSEECFDEQPTRQECMDGGMGYPHGNNYGRQKFRRDGEAATQKSENRPEEFKSGKSWGASGHVLTKGGGMVSREGEQMGLSGFSWINRETKTIECLDGKYRPVQPGIWPLADGVPDDLVCSGDSGIPANKTQEAMKMRIHGYGNAIVPQVAAAFIKAFMDARQEVEK